MPAKEVIIAHHDTVIAAGDHVIVFVPRKRMVRKIEKLFQVGVLTLLLTWPPLIAPAALPPWGAPPSSREAGSVAAPLDGPLRLAGRWPWALAGDS